MDYEVFLHKAVLHKQFGVGAIIKIAESAVTIHFETVGDKIFQFPNAFSSYLCFEDTDLQSAIQDTIRLNNKKEVPEVNKETSSSTGKSSVDKDEEILSVGLGEYTTHSAVLNHYFGFSYKNFQSAYKKIPNTHYAVWFPNIAKRINDKYISTDNTAGWINILSDRGKTIFQADNKETMRIDVGYQRITFTKEADGIYHFLGVFDQGVREGQGIRFSRIGKSFDVINMQIVD